MSTAKPSAEILPFRREPTSAENQVAMLEDWIEQARRGELKAVGIVAARKEGVGFHTQFCGWGGALLAPIQVLNARCLEDLKQ